MSVERVIPRAARRRVGNPFEWECKQFVQRYHEGPISQCEIGYWNDSDVDEVARIIGGFVKAVHTEELLATTVPPESSVEWVDGEVRHLDPRTRQVWLNTSLDPLPAGQRAKVEALFEEARVTRYFRGGILARGGDCARVAEVVAAFAFHVWRDVLLTWNDRPLALLACHEADVHLYSSDKTLLDTCGEHMKRLGLSELAPGPPWLLRPWTRPIPPEYVDD